MHYIKYCILILKYILLFAILIICIHFFLLIIGGILTAIREFEKRKERYKFRIYSKYYILNLLVKWVRIIILFLFEILYYPIRWFKEDFKGNLWETWNSSIGFNILLSIIVSFLIYIIWTVEGGLDIYNAEDVKNVLVEFHGLFFDIIVLVTLFSIHSNYLSKKQVEREMQKKEEDEVLYQQRYIFNEINIYRNVYILSPLEQSKIRILIDHALETNQEGYDFCNLFIKKVSLGNSLILKNVNFNKSEIYNFSFSELENVSFRGTLTVNCHFSEMPQSVDFTFARIYNIYDIYVPSDAKANFNFTVFSLYKNEKLRLFESDWFIKHYDIVLFDLFEEIYGDTWINSLLIHNGVSYMGEISHSLDKFMTNYICVPKDYNGFPLSPSNMDQYESFRNSFKFNPHYYFK